MYLLWRRPRVLFKWFRPLPLVLPPVGLSNSKKTYSAITYLPQFPTAFLQCLIWSDATGPNPTCASSGLFSKLKYERWFRAHVIVEMLSNICAMLHVYRTLYIRINILDTNRAQPCRVEPRCVFAKTLAPMPLIVKPLPPNIRFQLLYNPNILYSRFHFLFHYP